MNYPKLARAVYDKIEEAERWDNSLTMYKESIFGNRSHNDLDNLIENR